MYTLENSIQDILNDRLDERGLYLFCPEFFIQFLSEEQKKLSLKELKRHVSMPWGIPYFSEVVVDAANLVLQIEDDKTRGFLRLWLEEAETDRLPSSGEGKESCYLVCRISESLKDEPVKPAALIVPGGGYETVEMVNEGFRTAAALEARGYRVFILRYRVAPDSYPEPQEDLALAIKTIRANADRYRLDPDDLLVMGFSAGGHLVASETLYAEETDALLTWELEQNYPQLAALCAGISAKADKLCLGYPVVSMTKEAHGGSVQALTHGDPVLKDKLSVELHADASFPETFLWANDDDAEVPPSNAARLAQRLRSVGADLSYHVYPEGGHGCGLGTGTSCEGWIDEMTAWMKR